jgi:hypothetical protein
MGCTIVNYEGLLGLSIQGMCEQRRWCPFNFELGGRATVEAANQSTIMIVIGSKKLNPHHSGQATIQVHQSCLNLRFQDTERTPHLNQTLSSCAVCNVGIRRNETPSWLLIPSQTDPPIGPRLTWNILYDMPNCGIPEWKSIGHEICGQRTASGCLLTCRM